MVPKLLLFSLQLTYLCNPWSGILMLKPSWIRLSTCLLVLNIFKRLRSNLFPIMQACPKPASFEAMLLKLYVFRGIRIRKHWSWQQYKFDHQVLYLCHEKPVQIIVVKTDRGWAYGKEGWSSVVFAGPVCWTAKETEIELNPTAKDRTTGCSCTNSQIFQLPVARFVENLKKQKKNRSRLAATGPLSRHVLDLTHTHFSVIVSLWIIKDGQELVEIWPKTFLYAT